MVIVTPNDAVGPRISTWKRLLGGEQVGRSCSAKRHIPQLPNQTH